MVKHYLRYAIRNFKSNRLIFTGSILTVFLGTLCIALLATYIFNELSMDDFHKREKNIYLITYKQAPESKPQAWEADVFFGFNQDSYPEVENMTKIKKYEEGEIRLTHLEHSFSPEGIVVDSSFFNIFDFTLKSGKISTVLQDQDAIVLSDGLSKKLFGKENPIGKPLTVTSSSQKVYTVKGILNPVPSTSSMSFEFVIPDNPNVYYKMGGSIILVNENFNEIEFSKKTEKLGHDQERFEQGITGIFPLNKMYFEGNNVDTIGIFSKHGDKQNITVLIAIIVVIFIISLLNFSNLQVININYSIKNIGINKILGASKENILLQKCTEQLVIILFSSVFITLAFNAVLPYFNRIAGLKLSLGLGWVYLLSTAVLILLVAGAMIYPFIVYFYIPIVKSLKEQVFSGTKLLGRKTLTTLQFSLSFILLIASFVVVKQLNLMLDKDLGFNSENIIVTQLFHQPHYSGSREQRMEQYQEYLKDFQYVKNELASESSIKNYALGVPLIEPYEMSWKVKDGTKDFTSEKMLTVTPEYSNILNLNVLEGRFFSRDLDKNRSQKAVINEAAKKYWGITDISTTQIEHGSWGDYKIIGVVEDFNFEHLSVKPQPLVILFFENIENDFLIQFEEGSTQAGIQVVQNLFQKNNPGENFNYSFLSDDIQNMYTKEKRLGKIYIIFTIIAYIISAIGLLAISLYDTRKRTKEIGIRKVNGAKVSEVTIMLIKDFVKWVFFAIIIATPIAWYAMHRWLENFAYKTTLSWWVFVLAGILATIIALLTVGRQSFLAAKTNPVKSLRTE